jgi:hypothetical protein
MGCSLIDFETPRKASALLESGKPWDHVSGTVHGWEKNALRMSDNGKFALNQLASILR